MRLSRATREFSGNGPCRAVEKPPNNGFKVVNRVLGFGRTHRGAKYRDFRDTVLIHAYIPTYHSDRPLSSKHDMPRAFRPQ